MVTIAERLHPGGPGGLDQMHSNFASEKSLVWICLDETFSFWGLGLFAKASSFVFFGSVVWLGGCTWMCRWKLGSMVRINGLFHLLINGGLLGVN